MRLSSTFPFSALVCVIAAQAAPVSAATVVLQQGVSSYSGSIDAFVTTGPSNNLSANNYGGAGALAVSAAPATAPANTKGTFLSAIQFDLASVMTSFNSQFGVGQWTVTGATLTLSETPPVNSIFNGSGTTPANTAGNIDLRLMANPNGNSWTEGTGSPNSSGQPLPGINYNTLLSTYTGSGDQALGTFAFDGSTTGTFSAGLSLTSGLLTDIFGGGKASFEMLASSGSQVNATFNSDNFSTASARPSLSITAVASAPEPDRAMLVMAGMALTLARRRRR